MAIEIDRRGTGPRPQGHRARRPGSLVLVLAGVLALLAAACGGEGGGSASGDAGSPTTDPPGTTTAGSGSTSDDPLAPQPLAERTKVVAGWSGAYEVWASAIVAEGMGVFDAENLDVEFTTMTPADSIAGMETGRLDVMIGSIGASLFNAIHGGSGFRWVAPAFLPSPDTKEGLWMADRYLDASGRPDPGALEGTTLGLGSGGPGASIAPIVSGWLDEIGLTLDDFEYLNATGPDILVALETGAISAGWLSDPYWIEAERGDEATLVMGFPADASLSGYVLSADLLGERAEVGAAFVRALARANRDYLAGDYHADPAVVEVIAEAIGVEPERVASGSGYVFPADLAFDHAIVTLLQEGWISVGDILAYDVAMAPDRIIDTSPLPAGR